MAKEKLPQEEGAPEAPEKMLEEAVAPEGVPTSDDDSKETAPEDKEVPEKLPAAKEESIPNNDNETEDVAEDPATDAPEKETVESVPAPATEELSPEEQLKEMEKIVEAKEKKEDAEVSKQADEAFKKEEGRSEGPPIDPRQAAREERFAREEKQKLDNWVPRTELGKAVRAGKIKSIDEVYAQGKKIMEPEIVDLLLPNLIKDTLFIGQAKGKFGGGKRRAFRQTQKVSKEGSTMTFGVMAVVGDQNGHIGIGYGKAAETLPAKEKAFRKAKLNIIKIPRGCSSYDCSCNEQHSIPVATEGKCSSVTVKLIPAPQGTGLVMNKELKKIMKAAGIKDVYSRCFGSVRTTFNTGKACLDALNKLNKFEFD
jgi:small subunit ribosomal protein S5